MAQYGRPISDVATNGWTATPLYAKIDEASFDDGDFIQYNGVAYCEVALTASLSDPSSSSGHVVRYRLGRSRVDRTLTVIVRLMQGAAEIASWTHTDPDIAFQPFSQTLTELQANAITNYANLSLRFDITALQNNQVYCQVSWAELEIPDAAQGSVVDESASAGRVDTVAVVEQLEAQDAAGAARSLGTAVVSGLVVEETLYDSQ